MTARLYVQNVLGARRIDLLLADGITLVAGENRAGKSSTCMAAAMLLAGEDNPAGLKKQDRLALMTDGAKSASYCAIGSSDTDGIRLDLPGFDRQASGVPPSASRAAVGLARPSLLQTERDRQQFWQTYLACDPTDDDIRGELGRAGVAEVVIERVIDARARLGWDGAHDQAKDSGARLKGRWEQVAQTRYGSAVAARWTPTFWPAAAAGMTEKQAIDEVERCKEKLAAVNRAVGMEAGNIAALEEQAAALDESRLEVARLAAAQNKAEAEINAIAPRLAAGVAPTLSCPHCGGALGIERSGAMVQISVPRKSAIDGMPDGEVKAMRMRKIDLEAEIKRIGRELDQHRSRVTAGEKAAEALEKLRGRPAAARAEELAVAEGALRDAMSLRDSVVAYHQAQELARTIAQNAAIVKALAPDGVRLAVMSRAIRTWQEQWLDPLLAIVGEEWGQIRLESDLTISCDGRPYPLLSASERYRVDATLAIALARQDQSWCVVLDAADILDVTGRNGLFSMLAETGVRAIVGMTFLSMQSAPDLSADSFGGLGRTYWIADGVSNDLAALRAGRAA